MNENKLNLKNTFVELDLYENAINKLEILSSRVWKTNLNLKAGNIDDNINEDFVFGKILLQYNFVKQRLYKSSIIDVIADQISQVKNDNLERENQNWHDQSVVKQEFHPRLRSPRTMLSNRSRHISNGNITNSSLKSEINQDHGDSNQQIDDFKPKTQYQNAEKCKGDSWFNDTSIKTPTDEAQREIREPKKRSTENYNILASNCCEEENFNKIDSVYCSSIRTVGYDRNTTHASLAMLYNNPFDPRLKFQGLHLQTINSYSFKQKGFANENLFLAVPNISDLIEQHITISRIKLKMLSEEENNLTESEKSWLRSSHLFDDICRNEDVQQIIREPHLYTSRYGATEAERRVMEPLFSDRTRLIWYAPEIHTAISHQQPTPRRYRPGPVRRPPAQQPAQQPADATYRRPARAQNETSEQTNSETNDEDDRRTSGDELDVDLNCISMEMDSNMEPNDDATKESMNSAEKTLTQKDNGRANEKEQIEKELVQNYTAKEHKTENYIQQTQEPKHNIEKVSKSIQKSSHCLAQTMETPMICSTSISSPNRRNIKSKTPIQHQPSYTSVTNPKQTTQIDERPEQKTINGPISFSQNKSQVNIPIMNLAGEPMFQPVDSNLRVPPMNLHPPIYRLPPSLPQLPHDVQFRQQAFSNQSYSSVMCNLGPDNSKPALSTCVRNPPPGFAPLMNRFIIPTFPSPPSFSYKNHQGCLNGTSQNGTVEKNDSCTNAGTHQEQDMLKGPLTSTPKADQEGRQNTNKIENFTPNSDTYERNFGKQVPPTCTALSQVNTLSPVSHLINQQHFKEHVPQVSVATMNNHPKIESVIKRDVYNQDKNNSENFCFSKSIGIQQDPKQVSVCTALGTEQPYKQVVQNQPTCPQFANHEPMTQQTTHNNMGAETCQSIPNFFAQTPFQQPNFPKPTIQNGKSSGIGHPYNPSQEKHGQLCESQGQKTSDYFNSVNFSNLNPNVQNLQTKNIATSIQEIFQGIKQR